MCAYITKSKDQLVIGGVQQQQPSRSRRSTSLLTRSNVLRNGLCVALLICISGILQIQGVSGAAVMSVDLGGEWMKVGVVSPGVPMEIALNRESKRKTPIILAFRDGVRTFGEDAVTVGIREPAAAYGYLLDLLGKTVDNPIVALYKQRFPYYDIVADPVRNTVVFKRSDTEQFTVEELIAQILSKAKEFAETSTSQPITECVITVPGFFGQAEREALLTAAQLANLKVLQLINDYTAVALNYGVFHRAEINETAQYFVFYDMGAYKTSAAVVSYQLVRDKHTKEVHPVVQVLGVGYDRTLGGLEVQLRLRDYLAQEFNALKKTKTDVTKSPRALAKLFKEAGRVKNVLSANNDHYAQIENLIDDQDFKVQVTREKLEELCADLWPRVMKPLEEALSNSGLSLEVITQVIMFGGGTRVPKVQEIIKEAIKQELGKSLNADEAATMGAVYKAADLATGFKVKKFIIKDAVIFPIHVSFERDPGDGAEVKQVKRVLFGLMNSYPQKKVITFNKHTEDFDFFVHYGDLGHLSPQEISYLGTLNISRVELEKVKEVLKQHQTNEVVDSKGIKAYFVLDDSGVFRCTGVEFVFEKQKSQTEAEGGADDAESTLAKLGSTISKLFSKDGEKTTEKKEKQVEEEATNSQKSESSEEKPHDEEGSDGSEKESSEQSGNKTTTDDDNENKAQEDKDKSTTPKATTTNDTIKFVTVKEPVEHKITLQFTAPLDDEAFNAAYKKLDNINSAELERTRLESTFNALESHVIEMQQKLNEDEYASCITAEEKQKILDECTAISEWLYEDVENPTADLYEKRLNELKKLTNVFMARHWEHQERPDALKALDGMLDGAQKFLNTAKNLTKETNPEKDVFTQVEIDTLVKAIDDTVKWQKTETTAQNKLKRYEVVRLTVKDITDKMSLLDREVKYLVNKIKIWKPKTKPSTTKKEKKQSKKDSGDGGEAAEEENLSGSGNTADEPPTTGNETGEQQTGNESERESETDAAKEEAPQVEEPQVEELPEESKPKPSQTHKPTPRTDL